jgi:hypothetical protein
VSSETFSLLLISLTILVFCLGFILSGQSRAFTDKKPKRFEKGIWSYRTQLGEVPGRMYLTREDNVQFFPDYQYYSFHFQPTNAKLLRREGEGRLATLSFDSKTGKFAAIAFSPALTDHPRQAQLQAQLQKAIQSVRELKERTGTWPPFLSIYT